MPSTYDLLVDMAACLKNELDSADTPVCWVGVAPGDGMVPDAANCANGKCGQAWVRLAIGYPATRVGVQSQDLSNCDKPLGLDVEMGVARCFAVNQNTGGPSDPDAVSAWQVKDMETMRRALICCADSNINIDMILGQYRPAPIMGGVTGGIWLAHIGTEL